MAVRFTGRQGRCNYSKCLVSYEYLEIHIESVSDCPKWMGEKYILNSLNPRVNPTLETVSLMIRSLQPLNRIHICPQVRHTQHQLLPHRRHCRASSRRGGKCHRSLFARGIIRCAEDQRPSHPLRSRDLHSVHYRFKRTSKCQQLPSLSQSQIY